MRHRNAASRQRKYDKVVAACVSLQVSSQDGTGLPAVFVQLIGLKV
jgi:hypothetical protein